MSDLVVRGGGVVSIETEALLAEATRLAAAAHLLEGWAARAAGVRDRLGDLPGGSADVVGSLHGALLDLDTARSGFIDGSRRATELSWSLRAGAGAYARAEWLSTFIGDAGARAAAGLLGLLAPGALLTAAASAALLAPGVALAGAVAGREATSAALLALVERHGLPILSDPAFVDLVRASVDSADEFVAGLLRSGGLFGLGPGIDAPEGAALLVASAAALGWLTGAGALRETEVRVARVTPVSAVSPLGPAAHASTPPRGIGDLADRIPSPSPGGAQIRIERYDGRDGPSWIVYSSGTVDFGAVPGSEPYDTTSNLHVVADASERAALVGLSGDSGAAERAVRAAMASAGVAAGDPVLVVGHSAGGIVAANLAADPDLEVVGAVSLGGPVAQVPTADTPVLSVVHSEDLVPALGGRGVASDGRLVVERGITTAAPTREDPLPAHALVEYRGTARLIDESEHPSVAAFGRVLDGVAVGGSAQTTYWHAERVPADLTPSGGRPGR
ncbi:hypothetical protein [Agromyces arachidis]|uniref:hypothetical protein n=1 Tax=Agromyces arachidis TaxID=766966 RepID=UPI0040565F94